MRICRKIFQLIEIVVGPDHGSQLELLEEFGLFRRARLHGDVKFRRIRMLKQLSKNAAAYVT